MSDDEQIETGFAAVAANPEKVWREESTSEITVTVIPAVRVPLPPLSPHDLAKLARELATNIKEPHAVFKLFNLTQAQFDYLSESNEFFKQALHTSIIEWNSAMSTKDRIAVQAAAGVEDFLPHLFTRMGKSSEGLPGVVEAAKLMAKMAGVGEREVGAGAPGERFTITINLGDDNKMVVGPKDVTPENIQSADVGQASDDGQGPRDPQAVRDIPAGEGSSATFRLVTKGEGAAAPGNSDTKR